MKFLHEESDTKKDNENLPFNGSPEKCIKYKDD
jgi:hypothetical protein